MLFPIDDAREFRINRARQINEVLSASSIVDENLLKAILRNGFASFSKPTLFTAKWMQGRKKKSREIWEAMINTFEKKYDKCSCSGLFLKSEMFLSCFVVDAASLKSSIVSLSRAFFSRFVLSIVKFQEHLSASKLIWNERRMFLLSATANVIDCKETYVKWKRCRRKKIYPAAS